MRHGYIYKNRSETITFTNIVTLPPSDIFVTESNTIFVFCVFSSRSNHVHSVALHSYQMFLMKIQIQFRGPLRVQIRMMPQAEADGSTREHDWLCFLGRRHYYISPVNQSDANPIVGSCELLYA